MAIYSPKPILSVEKRSAFDRLGRAVEGEITSDMANVLGVASGIVRLLIGVEGRESGFGLRHLEAKNSRIGHLSSLGFPDVHGYVRRILSDIHFVGIQSTGRLILISEFENHYHQVVCQWDNDIGIWSVTTAIPKRHMRGIVVSWKKAG